MEAYKQIEKLIKYIDENYKRQPSLNELSSILGLSPFHLQRLFTDWAGISPKKFVQYLTLNNAKKILRENDMFETTFDSGLSSTSRLYDLFVNFEAVTPTEFKTYGKGLKIYYAYHESLFGKCLIAITDKGICTLHFVDDGNEDFVFKELTDDWPEAEFILDQEKTKKCFDAIFLRNSPEKINIIAKGTNFQIKVWQALLEIPEGTTVTYKDIAVKIGQPTAARAVGNAVGSNNISYLIPCHRVINGISKIGNYRWGSTRKKAILASEFARLNDF